MDWRKFLTTEWISFVALVSIATALLFKQPIAVGFVEWAGFCAACAVNLGVVRSWQKGQAVKK